MRQLVFFVSILVRDEPSSRKIFFPFHWQDVNKNTSFQTMLVVSQAFFLSLKIARLETRNKKQETTTVLFNIFRFLQIKFCSGLLVAPSVLFVLHSVECDNNKEQLLYFVWFMSEKGEKGDLLHYWVGFQWSHEIYTCQWLKRKSVNSL